MINISGWNIFGFAIRLAIVAIIVFTLDKIEEWRRRKEGRECIARFEAMKGMFRPAGTPLDGLLSQTGSDSCKAKGKISYETFFTDIEAMGFKEVRIKMFEPSGNFEKGPFEYLKKYVAKELFSDCSVVLYTHFCQPIPSNPKIHPASSHIRIDYIDNDTPPYCSLFTQHVFAELESFDGSLEDLINKLHGRFIDHRGNAIAFDLNNIQHIQETK